MDRSCVSRTVVDSEFHYKYIAISCTENGDSQCPSLTLNNSDKKDQGLLVALLGKAHNEISPP